FRNARRALLPNFERSFEAPMTATVFMGSIITGSRLSPPGSRGPRKLSRAPARILRRSILLERSRPMTRYRLLMLVAAAALSADTLSGLAVQQPPANPLDSLYFRQIGPAVMSGRVADLAVYEADPSIYYVGTAHSGVWKTTNNGTTFEAQFQDQGLMSIG